MRRVMCVLVAMAGLSLRVAAADEPAWSMNSTIIEACSCPMFCQCYFTGEPAGHAGHEGHGGGHFCKANNVFRVNTGHYGDTKLDGVKFWFAGDLGGDFAKGKMDWAIVTFDPSVTPAQRDGIKVILGHLYPGQWNSFVFAKDAPIEWTASKDSAVAKLDGGKAGEVQLKRFPGQTDEPIVIQNLRYWGSSHNDGFVLMPNTVEAYRLGDKAFEFKGTNGFMITFDIDSEYVAKQQQQRQTPAPAAKAQGS